MYQGQIQPPPPGTVCGDYAVNTIQPLHQPFLPGTPEAERLVPQSHPTIGDELTAAGVDWAWYSGGWDNAAGNVGGPGWTNGSGPACSAPDTYADATFPYCPNLDFQFHHQPLAYFERYAPGTQARRDHLRDEVELMDAARSGTLRPVSFVKPIGEENQHPGYASTTLGSDHLVDILDALMTGLQSEHTMVIVTYDEFGGQWDHVPPPVVDQWGPGNRVPTMVVSKALPASGVDSTTFDTTSVLKTIEQKYGLTPLADRDAAAAGLWGVFDLSHPGPPPTPLTPSATAAVVAARPRFTG